MLVQVSRSANFASVRWFFTFSAGRPGSRRESRRRALGLESLEPRLQMAACVPMGPVLAALADCRNWITYSPSQPYSPDNIGALTESHISGDLQKLYDAGFRGLVTYTLDGPMGAAPRIAKQIGFTQVIAGAFWYDDAQLAREKTAALAALPYIDAFIVGNEGFAGGVCQAVNGRQCYSRQQLETEIGWFQTHTHRPVSTTETGFEALNDPTLLDVGDFSTVNIQPWFNASQNPNDPAAMAQAVSAEYLALENLRPHRSIFVKEAWFSTSGNAAATPANQKAFFTALAQDTSVRFIWGESFDQPWKSESSPFGVLGPGWGLFDSHGVPKSVITDLAPIYSGSYNRVDEMLARAMTVLTRMNQPTATGGLPVNEATAADLDLLGQGAVPASQRQWVPGQVGFGLLTQIGSHAYRKLNSDFTAGLDDLALRDSLVATVGKLEQILGDSARHYTDPTTNDKAFYQRYDTLTATPLFRDTFENAIPLIDNVELFAGLRASGIYLDGLKSADLAQGVTLAEFTALARRIDALLKQMSFRMWFDGTDLRIGGGVPLGSSPSPLSGSRFDRITAETRLAPVVALANGDLTLGEFNRIVSTAVKNSKIGSSPAGSLIERVPFAGTALELVGATPLVSSELGTLYGQGTLLTAVAAYENVVHEIGAGLPAFGATGIADGNGGFRRFALSPSEDGSNPDRDRAVLGTMAAGMIAGSLGKSPVAGLQADADRAVDNLEHAIGAAAAVGKYHPTYGLPNAIDLGAGAIAATSIWGYLEVAEFATSLLQYKLGGSFFEELLRGAGAWHGALEAYGRLLNDREMEAVATNAPGVSACRANAGGGILNGTILAGQVRDCAFTWHIQTVGDTLAYALPIARAGRASIAVTYANDDTGVGDSIAVLVDGQTVSSFHALDTNSWEAFATTASLELGDLAPGLHVLSFRLDTTDGFGIDFDRFSLTVSPPNTGPWQNPLDRLNVDDNRPASADPIDALLVINVLNESGGLLDAFGRLPPSRPLNSPFGFLDVDGDGYCAPIDALLVINFLNGSSAAEGEFAASGPPSSWPISGPSAAPSSPTPVENPRPESLPSAANVLLATAGEFVAKRPTVNSPPRRFDRNATDAAGLDDLLSELAVDVARISHLKT